MVVKRIIIFFIFLFSAKAYSQLIDYENTLQQALSHRQTQNAAHVILWNTEHFLLNIDSFSIDQSKGQLRIQSGRYLVIYSIKISGTYNHNDSIFMWSTYNNSINKALTTPVSHLMDVAAFNNWQIAKGTMIKCSFDSAYNLAALPFYLDKANGINHIMTNNGQTNIIFSFYEVEIFEKGIQAAIKKVPVQNQYKRLEAPALIEICKSYVEEYDANEKKYAIREKQNNDSWKYADTMFANRIKISDKYWDTTSVHYNQFRTTRLQPQDLGSIINWRVIEVERNLYVLYDEKEPWGSLRTWAFKICGQNGKYKICNEYLCF
jgi:hypothetical protein